MEITQEVLLNRLAEYEQREQSALADANAAHGACMAMRDLLQVLAYPAGTQETVEPSDQA